MFQAFHSLHSFCVPRMCNSSQEIRIVGFSGRLQIIFSLDIGTWILDFVKLPCIRVIKTLYLCIGLTRPYWMIRQKVGVCNCVKKKIPLNLICLWLLWIWQRNKTGNFNFNFISVFLKLKRARPMSRHLDWTSLVNKGFNIWPRKLHAKPNLELERKDQPARVISRITYTIYDNWQYW